MLQNITKKIKNIASHISLLTIGLLCFLAMITYAVSTVETTNAAEKKSALEDAIMRSALHCYSLEGAYPADISYLEENYSLSINWDTYIVHYERFASNIAPDITVIVKSDTSGGTT